MGVQSFVKTAFASCLSTFDAESITVSGVAVSAVIDETASSNALGAGAKKGERGITVQFPSGTLTTTPKSGDTCVARGETWQVSADEGAVRIGQIATTLELVEPGRRRDIF